MQNKKHKIKTRNNRQKSFLIPDNMGYILPKKNKVFYSKNELKNQYQSIQNAKKAMNNQKKNNPKICKKKSKPTK